MFQFDLFEKLLKLPVGVTQPANADAFQLLSSIHPIELKAYESGREHNGWVIPHEWHVHKALIRRNEQIVFDGTVHPMAVAGYSTSFQGTLNKKQLDEHIFFNKEFPDAFVFHCMYNYRPWEQHWGFCVPLSEYQKWDDGPFEVEFVSKKTYTKG